MARWSILAGAWLFLLARWFDDPAAAAGEPRATSLWAPVVAFVVAATLTVRAHRDGLARMHAELAEMLRLPRREAALLGIVLVVSFVFQLPAMVFPAALLHADAALNGLMAMHIAEGRVAPAFYYGQEFMGTLFSHVLAVLFAVTGPFAAGVPLLAWAFYAGFLTATFHLVRRATDGLVAFAVAVWLALPVPLLAATLVQTEYAQLLLLSSSALLVVAAALAGPLRRPAWWLLAGGLLGLAFWAHAMASLVIAAVAAGVGLLLPPSALPGAATRLAAGLVVGLTPALVGWGARLPRFVEWFFEGGGRGGDATLAQAAAALARRSLPELFFGSPANQPAPWLAAALLTAVVVLSAVGILGVSLAGVRRRDERARRAPSADLVSMRAAAALPLAAFVLLHLGVLASRGYHDVPTQYVVPLYLGVPTIVAVAVAWMAGHRRAAEPRLTSSPVRRRPASLAAAAIVLLWAAYLLPGSIAWLRTLPANQASMNASLAALHAAGIDTCIGPYWDAYRLSYLTGEQILCESIDVRRVPGYPERVAARAASPPPFVAAPQRRDALEEHRRRLEERGIEWVRLQTPRFEVLIPREPR